MNEKSAAAETEAWDVVVVGGGPGGMMAAGRAAERGLTVLLLEKNAELGKKLLITGGGRCNVTNAEFDNRKLLAKFKGNGKYLFSAFSQWSVRQTLDFFDARSTPTKVEALQRVFPLTERSQSVWNALVENLKKTGVTVLCQSPVSSFIKEGAKITGVILKNKKEIRAASVILATGGKSHPETGSTGDGFAWLRQIGHSVSEPSAALVPLAIDAPWIARLAGLTLNEVKIHLLQNDTKQGSAVGKVLFTHVGVSGPTILNMSKDVSELLKYGEVVISLDLLPNMDHSALNAKLQEVFKEHDKKKFKNSLAGLLPSSLAPIVVELSRIEADKQCNAVSRQERLDLITLLKNFKLPVRGLLGVNKAIVTSGGVSLDEVDFRTMRSRKFDNLYLVGDILDIDRPSGGYSLQLCWTTGYVAGNSVGRDGV